MNQYQEINEDQISSCINEKENDLTYRKKKNNYANKQDMIKKMKINQDEIKQKGIKKANFSMKSKSIMADWFLDHIEKPYLSTEEKTKLAIKSGLTDLQVCNWFTNIRKRIWQPLLRQKNISSPEFISLMKMKLRLEVKGNDSDQKFKSFTEQSSECDVLSEIHKNIKKNEFKKILKMDTNLVSNTQDNFSAQKYNEKKEDEDLFEFFNRGIPLLNSTNILDKKPDIPSNKRELKQIDKLFSKTQALVKHVEKIQCLDSKNVIIKDLQNSRSVKIQDQDTFKDLSQEKQKNFDSLMNLLIQQDNQVKQSYMISQNVPNLPKSNDNGFHNIIPHGNNNLEQKQTTSQQNTDQLSLLTQILRKGELENQNKTIDLPQPKPNLLDLQNKIQKHESKNVQSIPSLPSQMNSSTQPQSDLAQNILNLMNYLKQLYKVDEDDQFQDYLDEQNQILDNDQKMQNVQKWQQEQYAYAQKTNSIIDNPSYDQEPSPFQKIIPKHPDQPFEAKAKNPQEQLQVLLQRKQSSHEQRNSAFSQHINKPLSQIKAFSSKNINSDPMTLSTFISQPKQEIKSTKAIQKELEDAINLLLQNQKDQKKLVPVIFLACPKILSQQRCCCGFNDIYPVNDIVDKMDSSELKNTQGQGDSSFYNINSFSLDSDKTNQG